MTTVSEDRLRLERLLPAPMEEVFAAWTEGESMARWMSPVGHAEVEIDLRVSGRFRVVMVGDEMRIEHTGKYLEVDPPRLLSFTWQSPYTGPEPSVVTVTLAEDGNQTRLVLVHERLPNHQVEAHAGGWASMVDRLETLLDLSRGLDHDNP